jgi:hypothetical protein
VRTNLGKRLEKVDSHKKSINVYHSSKNKEQNKKEKLLAESV